MPAELEALVMRCLQKRPEDRFAGALELEAALASVPLEKVWSGEAATAWWSEHLPVDGRPAAEAPEADTAPTLRKVPTG